MAEIAAGAAAAVVVSGVGILSGLALVVFGGQKAPGGTGGGCGGTCNPPNVCNPATNTCGPGCTGCSPPCTMPSVCDAVTCKCVTVTQGPACPSGCPGGWCDTTPCGSTITQGCGVCRAQITPCTLPAPANSYCDEIDCGSLPTNGCGTWVQNGFCRTDGECGPNQYCEMLVGCGSPPLAGCGTCLNQGQCFGDFDCSGSQCCLGGSTTQPGQCGTCPSATWEIANFTVASVNPQSAVIGGQVSVALSFVWIGPGGDAQFGVYVDAQNGGCTYSFQSPYAVNLSPSGSFGTTPYRIAVAFSFPNCLDCTGGATQFNVQGWLTTPDGQTWLTNTCVSCLNC